MQRNPKVVTGILLMAAVLVVFYAFLGMMYYKKQQESNDLKIQIARTRAILQKPPPDIDGLRRRLEQTGTESQSEITSFPKAEQGVDIYAALVAEGREGNIDILNIKAASPIAPPQGKSGETILPYSLVIRGSHDDTLAFISSLTRAGGLLEGMELKNVGIRSTGSSSEPDNTELGLYVHTWSDVADTGEAIGQAGGSQK